MLNYRVGEDGILHLDVPLGLNNADLEITVTVQPVTSNVALYERIRKWG